MRGMVAADVTAVVYLISMVALGGKLDDARDSTSGGSDSSSSDDSASSWSSFDADDDDPGNSDSTGNKREDTGRLVGALFSLPRQFLGDNGSNDPFYYYPYADNEEGYMDIDSSLTQWVSSEYELLASNDDTVLVKKKVSPLSIRLAGEYCYDLDGLHRPSIYGLLEGKNRFGLESGWSTFFEPLEDGSLDYLTIGDLNITYRFAQGRNTQFRAGVGGRIMIDGQNSTGGFNFTYGMDVFPQKPVVVSLSGDLGNLGKAFFVHGRIQLGAAVWRLEPYIAYDVMAIGDVIFHGPVVGLRFWL